MLLVSGCRGVVAGRWWAWGHLLTSGAISTWYNNGSADRLPLIEPEKIWIGGWSEGPYTMESSVAAMDATPAVTVAAASNFCPVPPLIFADSLGAWNGGTGCVYLSEAAIKPHKAWRCCGMEPQRGVDRFGC